MSISMPLESLALDGLPLSPDERANTEEGSNGEDQNRKQEYQVDGARIAYHNS
jgi:hypothetical protein